MNKIELTNLVDSLNLPLGEYSIGSSGSLVIRDIYDKAGDLDLQVTEKCFEHIKNSGLKYHFKDEKHEYNHPLYEFDDVDAEFFVMPLEEIHFDYVDGYPCQDVLDILAFKKQRNLPKDQEPIAKIETYLNTKKR